VVGEEQEPDESGTGPATPGSAHGLRGRARELAVIGAGLERMRAGLGMVLVIEGAPGMGKSLLIGEAAGMATRGSISVGRGGGDPADRIVQLAPLMEALFHGPVPVLHRSDLTDVHSPPEQRFWLLEQIEELLERASIHRPVLICLDDLQWADAGTLAVLRALPARLSSLPVGWILAARPAAGSPQLHGVLDHLRAAGAATISLGPLDGDAVAEVIADTVAAQPDDRLLALAATVEGNPFLLAELLRGLIDEDLVRIREGTALLVEARLPNTISQSMQRRLRRTSEEARRTAVVAASLARRFTLEQLAAMLDRAPAALLAALEELVHAGVLQGRDGGLAFVHDLTREAARASVPASARRALDRQAATVLLERGACAAEVAMQLAASAEPDDEVAITTMLAAAEAVAATDPGVAADLGVRALELAADNHSLRGRLVAGTAVWLHAAARPEDAKAFADTALRHVLPPVAEAQVRLSISGMFALSPDLRAAANREALALPGLPGDLRGRHLANLLHNLVTAGRMVEAADLLDQVRCAVRESDDVRSRFTLDLAESGLEYAAGRYARALELVTACLRARAEAGDGTRAHLGRQWRADILATLDRLEEARALSVENVAAAQRHHQGWAVRAHEIGLARRLLQLGALSDAAAILQGRFTVEVAHEVVSVQDAAAVGALARIAIHTGDADASRTAGVIARVMLDQSAPSVRRHAAWALAGLEMAAGRPAAAHRWLCALGHAERTSIIPLFPLDVGDQARLVHIALAAGDHDLAAQSCTEALRRSQLNPGVQSLAAAAAHAGGVLAADLAALSTAVELYEHGGRPLVLAAALEDLGAVALADGDTGRGVDAFGRALVLVAAVGAVADAARLRGRLRALGVRRRLVAAARPATGWAGLSDSEAGVGRLVVQGLTNRQVASQLFVSQHTVDAHLRKVFAKLGVRSRLELTRLVDARELAADVAPPIPAAGSPPESG
jgi:DNA-binding CsgD family transcriptional regulator